MDTYVHIYIHMDTYGYIWGPKGQALAQNWRRAQMGQGPGTLPPVLGQGLALGPPWAHVGPYLGGGCRSGCINIYEQKRICRPYLYELKSSSLDWMIWVQTG